MTDSIVKLIEAQILYSRERYLTPLYIKGFINSKFSGYNVSREEVEQAFSNLENDGKVVLLEDDGENPTYRLS